MEEMNDIDICYICKKPGEDLVKPCATVNCPNRSHRICTAQQFKSGRKCDECQEPIIQVITKNFNTYRCCQIYLQRLFLIFMVICGPLSVILLTLGKTLTTWIICPDRAPPNYRTCDDLAGVGILISLPLSMVFYQFPNCCYCCCCPYDIFCCAPLNKILKYKSELTMGTLYLLSYALVLLAHGIGYPIIKSLFGIDEFFTWRTSMAGFIVYYIITVIIILGLIITSIICACIEGTTNAFTETHREFGVTVDKLMTDDTKLIS